MAEVWMARREAIGGASKTLAIKLLATHLSDKPVYRQMFVDEARLTMMLGHSNVVSVFDVGEHAGRSYLVMEWIDGLDLAQLGGAMRELNEPFSFVVVAHVIGELLRGLGYAHELREGQASRAIVHRDVSPHNVLISVSGEVKISDFGVARLASEETSGLHVRGKLRYMPPEQMRGVSKHPTVDLFAVGAVLQELLDGVRFRAGLDRDALFAMVIQGQVPPLRRAEVPAELLALRDGLLAPEPSERIQSAAEALALLRRWPGYRNAADELAAMVRDHAGIAGPRSGLTIAVSDDELELSGPEPRNPEPSPPEPTRAESRAADDSSDLQTQALERAAQSSHTTPALGDEPTQSTRPWPGRRGWTRRVPIAVGIGVAGFGVLLGLLLGFGGSRLGAGEGSPALAAASAPVIVGAPPTSGSGLEGVGLEPGDSRELATPQPRTQASAPQPDAEFEPDPAGEPERSKARATSSSPSKAKPRAKVEVAAHEFFFVWIKIAGREYALEPVADLSLSPGKHAVYLRENPEQAWRKAGKIEVAAGKRYRVALRKPNSVSVEALD
jgi:eukaryotic-like serine/threonine-protein kinase